jgi:hypothetical protein
VLELLAAIHPKHFRIDLDLASKDWPKEWRRASNVADRLDAKLHAALFLTENAEGELSEFRAVAQPTRVAACLDRGADTAARTRIPSVWFQDTSHEPNCVLPRFFKTETEKR